MTLDPAFKPVTVLASDDAVVITAPFAGPRIVHRPVAPPGEGALPASVKLAVLHSSWSKPAFAATGGALLVSTTSSKLEHEPFAIVHLNVTLKPALSPVTVVVAELILVITAPFAAPWIVQVPVPGAAAFPANVKIAVLHKV